MLHATTMLQPCLRLCFRPAYAQHAHTTPHVLISRLSHEMSDTVVSSCGSRLSLTRPDTLIVLRHINDIKQHYWSVAKI